MDFLKLFSFSIFISISLAYNVDSIEDTTYPVQEPDSTSINEFNVPFTDCSDVQRKGYNTGVHEILPTFSSRSFKVYCNFDFDGGPWTILQHRFNGGLDFYKNFSEYSSGFGSASGEHWAGLEVIHQLTSNQDYELYIELVDFENEKKFANYKVFSIDSKEKGYRLRVGNYSGNAGDSLAVHNLQTFSTFDVKYDAYTFNSAILYHGAWWYQSECHDSNLNGRYLFGAIDECGVGMMWKTWKGYKYSLKSSKMMIRPVIPIDTSSNSYSLLTLEELDKRFKIQEEELEKVLTLQNEKTNKSIQLQMDELESRFSKLEEVLSQLVEQNLEYSNILKTLVNVCSDCALSKKVVYPEDCSCVSGTFSGVYLIQPEGVEEPFSVYCDLTSLNEKWTVFQRRIDGGVDFYRNYLEYENGFGDLGGEHWLGLEKLYQIQKDNEYELYIHISDFDNVYKFARYGHFSLNSGKDGYRIQISDYSGDAGDSLNFQRGQRFSTYDRDEDSHKDTNCAKTYKGAWWYAACHAGNLNGFYGRGQMTEYATGVTWSTWRGSYYSFRTTKMMIRRTTPGQCRN